MKRFLILFFIIPLISINIHAQQTTKKVLFMGNSYTAGLPNVIAELAASVGDSLIFYDGSGGQTIKDHATSQHSLSSISQDQWDYVVIQCQSQEAAYTNSYVRNNVLPYAKFLADSVRSFNPCTKTVFYMTWGRKNGDAANCQNWPPVCTFEGMQMELRKNYLKMGNDNNAFVSPVGMAWRHARQEWPNIELYDIDESHASPAGMHLSASTFYAVLFGKSPLATRQSGGVPPSEQDSLNKAANTIVFDSLSTWNLNYVSGISKVSYTVNDDTVQFKNHNSNLDSALWEFGDGNHTWQISPQHIYDTSGTYRVITLSFNSCMQFDTTFEVTVTLPKDTTIADTTNEDTASSEPSSIVEQKHRQFSLYPNPTSGRIKITLNHSMLDKSTVEFVLFNLEGRALLKIPLVQSENDLLLPDDYAGVYLYSIAEGPLQKLVIVN